MNGTGKAAVCMAAVVLVLAAVVVAWAQQGERKAPPAVAAETASLAFLEVGKTYIIQFAPGADSFMFKTTEIDPDPVEIPSLPADGSVPPTLQPSSSTVTMTYRVPEFVVKKLGSGSWALLEIPLDVKAATKRWDVRLSLMNKELLAEAEKTADGRKGIAEAKKQAEQKVNTTEAWVNLAHAILIAPPIVDPKDPRLDAISVSVEINRRP